jgi:GNAT superfamily N-acetyltransferase
VQPSIVPLPPDRVRQAVRVLSTAFAADPIFSHYFPDAAQHSVVLGAFFDDIVRSHLRFGHVYAALLDGSLVGAALWRPPDARLPTARDRQREMATERRVRAVDPIAADALFAGFAATLRDHPAEPHWYLFFTGIEPALQGRGLGSLLLAPVLAIADRSRTLCYLETPFPRTHEFYRRLGFEMTQAGRPFSGAPTLWTMTRRPT